MLEGWARDGLTDEQIAHNMGINVATLYKYKQKYSKQDIQDLNLGILRPEEYRAKWRGEPIEEALKNLPQAANVIE